MSPSLFNPDVTWRIGRKISAAMKSASQYALDCKNLYCAIGPHEIRIPASKLFEPPPNPSLRAAKHPYENIACPLCKHVYEYTYGDVRCHSFQRRIKIQPALSQAVFQ